MNFLEYRFELLKIEGATKIIKRSDKFSNPSTVVLHAQYEYSPRTKFKDSFATSSSSAISTRVSPK